jgi:plastocyanin
MRKSTLTIIALVLVGALAIGPAVASAGNPTIRVGNDFFSPDSKTVKRGTTVRFKWDGGVRHNVTKRKGPGGSFKSKTTKKAGVNFQKTFKKTGTYKMICTLHPDEMKLTLKVT